MMLKPSIDTLLDKVPSKYSLVILEAKRAHELEAGAPATQGFKSEKSTLRALEEIESGNVTIHPDPEGKREAVRRRIEEEKRRKEEEEKKIKEQIHNNLSYSHLLTSSLSVHSCNRKNKIESPQP